MGKKTPSAPAPPDPKATADAQSKANIDAILASAAINRFNTYTPFGSQEYYQSPTGQYAQYVTPSGPEAERIALGYGVNNATLGRTAQLMEQTPTNFQFSGLPDYQTGINMENAPDRRTYIDLSGHPVGSLDMRNAPGMVTSLDMSGAPAYQASLNMAGSPQMVTEIDSRLLPDILSPDQYASERQRIEDAVYGRMQEKLDERFGRERESLQSQLANQGIGIGAEAFTRANRDFALDSNDAYKDALVSALQLGGSEFDRAFGQSMAGRQQLVGEQLSTAGLTDRARQQQMAEQLAGAGLASQARQGTMAEQLAGAGLANQGRQQFFGEQLASAGLTNQARGMELQEQLALAGLLEQARQGYMQEQLIPAQMSNDARARMVQEQLAARAVPFQELAQLRGGMPAFGLPNFGSPAQYQVAPADISGAINNNYASQQNAYNQQLASRNSTMGNIFGLGGALGAAGINAIWSDERMKEGIEPTNPDDALNMIRRMPVSEWAYKPEAEQTFGLPGGRHMGTMAQDFQEVSGKGDGTSIPTVDAIGMLMAAVQSLANKVDRRAS